MPFWRRLRQIQPLLIGLVLACAAQAQDQHVSWTLTAEPAQAAPGGKLLLRMTGKIDEGWHLYSMSTPGASPTKIQVSGPAVDSVRSFQAKPRVAHDPN